MRPRIAAALIVIAVAIVLGRIFATSPGRPIPAPLPPDVLEFRALEVGQGDSLLVRLGDHAMLVDAGPDRETARDVIAPRLGAMGVERLDALILTHADGDHIGGASYLLDALPIGQLVVADLFGDHPVYPEIVLAAARRGVPIRTVGAGDRVPWHTSATVLVLNPDRDAEGVSDNDRSIAMRVVYGASAFLLTGDLEASAERRLIDGPLNVADDVLKVGHHGAATSSSGDFLDAVGPTIAVIPAGRDNSLGHPREAVIDRLLERGIAVFRTDLAGDVAVRTDGATLTVRVERGGGVAG